MLMAETSPLTAQCQAGTTSACLIDVALASFESKEGFTCLDFPRFSTH